jgi:hypothetical protein
MGGDTTREETSLGHFLSSSQALCVGGRNDGVVDERKRDVTTFGERGVAEPSIGRALPKDALRSLRSVVVHRVWT